MKFIFLSLRIYTKSFLKNELCKQVIRYLLIYFMFSFLNHKFSNLSTPRGQTALHIPHPTHDARTMSS